MLQFQIVGYEFHLLTKKRLLYLNTKPFLLIMHLSFGF